MKNICLVACFVALICCIFLAVVDQADAKRMGGGKSFGSKPAYSQNYQKSTPPPSAPGRQATPGVAPNPGRSGLGGMFGGLLLGGLLGSLFFGGPFSGLNLMDVLLIGGGLFFLFRMLRARRPAMRTANNAPAWEAPDNAWAHLRSSDTAGAPTASVPKGFDTEEFLSGAKAAYIRLQSSWDKRDLEAVRQFTSPEVFAEISAQAKADPNPGKTEILMVDAQLLEVKTVGNQTIATVLFDALLREESPAAPAEQVREAWHFSRYETGGDKYWVVEGIQQMQ